MIKFYITYHGESSKDKRIKFYNNLVTPVPAMRYKETQIPGRDGLLYEKDGLSEIEVSFDAEILDKKEIKNKYRKIKKWLSIHDENNRLILSDDPAYFYLANKVELPDGFETILQQSGLFKVVFTCEPVMYLSEGLAARKLETTLYNPCDLSYPTYMIKGEGLLRLTINGVTVTANIGQNLMINTKLGLCYREDGTLNNIALTGEYEDMLLKEGENHFIFSSGFDVQIIPNWQVK